MFSEREIRFRCAKVRWVFNSLPSDEHKRMTARATVCGWLLMQEDAGANRRDAIKHALRESAEKSAQFTSLPRRVHAAIRLLGYKPDFNGIRLLERFLEYIDFADNEDNAMLLLADMALVDEVFEKECYEEVANG